MRYCTKCVQPDTRPGVYFNEEGVCGACLWQEEMKHIDWEARERELKEIAEWAKRTTKTAYDCAIGVSGGKDSTFQALYARERLGLRALLVNSEPENITEIGRHNIENLKNLGFDVFAIRPNPRLMKKLVRRDFFTYLNPVKITEYSLWSSVYIIANVFDIPLIIQGENTGLTLGVRNTGLGVNNNAFNAQKCDTLASGYEEYIGGGVEEKDLFLFHYDAVAMQAAGIKAIWLGYYIKEWSQPGNAEFSRKHGLAWRPEESFKPEEIGTYVRWSQLDSDIVQVNQLLKYVKFGFGQCTDHACFYIREGRICREEGIELVRKYDGKCATKYIQAFCDYIGISLDEFWQTVEKFRNKEIFKKNQHGEWVLKNPIWEYATPKGAIA